MQDGSPISDLVSLRNQVALVTGAGRGLGLSIAETLAQAGAHVILNDLNPEAVERQRVRLLDQGLSASASVFDVTDHEAADREITAAGERLGRIDIVVNNAGNQNRKPFVDYSYAEWRAIIDTHVLGAFNVTQPATRFMLRQGHGRIVMISSIAAKGIRGTLTPYATAKGALISFTRALAAELGSKGITCNAIGPSFLATEFTQTLVENPEFTRFVEGRVPAGRWGTPEDVAPVVLFLASAAGAFVNGTFLPVDGGTLAAL